MPRMKIVELSADRKSQILDATVHIIGNRGYYGFSIKEVAQSCDITAAGVLHHFGSKEGLLVALLADRHVQDANAIMSGFNLTGQPMKSMKMDLVLRILREIIVRNLRQPEIVRLYSILRAEALYPGHPAFEYFERRERTAQKDLLELIDGKVANSHSAMLHVIATQRGLESLWLRDPSGFDLVGEWDNAIARILG